MRARLIAAFATFLTLCGAGCGETQVQPEPEKPDIPATPIDPAGDRTNDGEDPLEICFDREVAQITVSRSEAESRGLYTIDKTSERFMGSIVKPRRRSVNMKPGAPSSIVVTLEDAANLRWSKEYYNDYPCAVKGDTVFVGTDVWIHNPLAIDYGPVIARSISPTEIEITRKENVSPSQKPVEILLERSFIGTVPFEYGVRAALAVELSDAPADSRDTGFARYVTMDEADRLGLFHMPFDTREFLKPIAKDGHAIAEIPQGQSSVTVVLDSPAMPESNMVWHQGCRPIGGVTFFDRDAMEWIFTPSCGSTPSLDFIMTDPLHITISLGEDFDLNYPNDMSVRLVRGDYWNASDAGETYAIIDVIIK